MGTGSFPWLIRLTMRYETERGSPARNGYEEEQKGKWKKGSLKKMPVMERARMRIGDFKEAKEDDALSFNTLGTRPSHVWCHNKSITAVVKNLHEK